LLRSGSAGKEGTEIRVANFMKPFRSEYLPVNGKTYSLFGKSGSTLEYYETIRSLADKILEKNPDICKLIDNINQFSSKKKYLRRILTSKNTVAPISTLIQLIDPFLKEYTENTEEHLRTLPVSKFWDQRLATTREQYHLYMLEIELTNRLSAASFKKADKRIALLPYCLQDFSVKCKSEKNGFDYQCRHCSAGCYQNQASEILKKHDIEPYIWMGGDMKQLAKYTLREKRTFAVLGIACIPELMWGMRNCRKNNIPVVGLPLNANRCIRWFGEFFPNSIDLNELGKLISE
jgi:hypothetical protein